MCGGENDLAKPAPALPATIRTMSTDSTHNPSPSTAAAGPHAYGWAGEKVRLVPLDKDRHYENAVRWLNNPLITAWTLMGDYPLTRLQETDYFEKASRPSETDVSLAVELLGEPNDHIGFAGIHKIEQRNGVGTIGLIIGRPQLWNRGLGTDAIRVMLRYCFEVLGLRIMLAEAMGENVPSQRAIVKAGMREWGRIPQRIWKRGAYRDSVNFYASRDEWVAGAAGK
jgi:[ribosomal protein S5]-alanine N-acetyltransferase